MTGTVTGLFTYKYSRSYLNHLVVTSCWSSFTIILTMHGHTNAKFIKTLKRTLPIVPDTQQNTHHTKLATCFLPQVKPMVLAEEKSVSFPQAVFVLSVWNNGETFL